MSEFAARTVFYAIGDIHGEASRLETLHAHIFGYHKANASGRPIAIIHLGDYIDRGPDSRGVIDTIMSLERKAAARDDLTVLSIRGNHEEMLLDALEGDASALQVWLTNGGHQTLASYRTPTMAADEVLYHFPYAHRAWLEDLPFFIHDETRKLMFVHAGVNPKTFPECDPQHYLWTRSPRFFNTSDWGEYAALNDYLIVHGHTPTRNAEPEVSGANQRINVDTGAVYGGPLTAVVIDPGQPPSFLQVH